MALSFKRRETLSTVNGWVIGFRIDITNVIGVTSGYPKFIIVPVISTLFVLSQKCRNLSI
jgi:hypothetical protein